MEKNSNRNWHFKSKKIEVIVEEDSGDLENIDINELKECGSELEAVYAANEQLINSKINEITKL